MIGQRLLTDNRRLRIARDRAAGLRRLAAQMPPGSARRQAMQRLARPVTMRITMAAAVPLAVVLGPMVMSFLWFPCRVDPAAQNARPGASVYVVASVDGEWTGPVVLEHDADLTLDELTPASQTLPPIRATLKRRLAQWQQSSDLSRLPWELQQVGRQVGKRLVDDLGEYLSHDIPPQTLGWTLSTPDEKAGRFEVRLSAGDAAPLAAAIVLGDPFPPPFKEDLGDGKGPVQVVRPHDSTGPIQWVRVMYSQQKTRGQDVFWAPLSVWGWGFDFGWLLTYILIYVPAMFALRFALRLP
jgi:hypothetical protein